MKKETIKILFRKHNVGICRRFLFVGWAAVLILAVACKRSDGPPPSGKNVVLVVIEALPAKTLGCYGGRRGISPNIDRIASEGIRFNRFRSAAPWTMPSFGTMLSGLAPPLHRAGRYNPHPVNAAIPNNLFFGLRPGVVLLPQMLHGVDTGAVINNPFLHADFGFSKGWGTYDFHDAGFGGYRIAEKTTDRAASWLKEHLGKRVFLLVHYFDTHLPYISPEPYRSHFACGNKGRIDMSTINFLLQIQQDKFRPNKMEEDYLRCLHDAEVAYTDAQVGRLFKYMDRLGYDDNTWLVITADHGEELFEHGKFEHGHRYEDEVTRVPLIIRPPGGRWKRGTLVKPAARHLDMAPTILEWFGQKPTPEMEGKSLMPLITGAETAHRPAYMTFNLSGTFSNAYDTGELKLIESLDRKEAFMYDIVNDPNEMHRLGPEHPAFEKLRKTLRSIHDNYEKRVEKDYVEQKQVPLSNDVLESLKSLGYIE